tara:strand:- start:482 stop:913 length:432 start_codon:yes stop_codon:yes gene_type:complete
MFSPAQQGFGRVAANTGLNTLGSLTGRNFERDLQLGGTALKGKAAIEAAKARGRAIEYSGRQAGNAAIFGGAMNALGSLGGAAIGSGMFKGGGGDFSPVDAQTMGMPTGQANYIDKGGFTYWDTDMGNNQWKPMGFGSGFGGF